MFGLYGVPGALIFLSLFIVVSILGSFGLYMFASVIFQAYFTAKLEYHKLWLKTFEGTDVKSDG